MRALDRSAGEPFEMIRDALAQHEIDHPGRQIVRRLPVQPGRPAHLRKKPSKDARQGADKTR